MAGLSIYEGGAWFTLDIDGGNPVVEQALDDERAESVVRSAMYLAVAVLAQGGTWPTAALEVMAAFMRRMRAELEQQQLM